MKHGISVIVPAYKAVKYLKETLDSIKQQTYFENHKNYEIILGIDGCEETLNYIKSIRSNYENFRILYMPENKGTYITINTLIHNCKYEYITIFGADDIMKSDMIEYHMKTLESCDVVSGICAIINDDDKKNIIKVSNVGDGVMSFNKKILNSLGGFMPWSCAADSEFRQRLKNSNKFKHIRIPRIDFVYRRHAESVTNKIETNDESPIRNKYRKYISETANDNNIKIKPIINNFKEI